MAHRQASRASSLLKPYLKRFMLQTHPDFFSNDPAKKKVNAESLQRLHGLLNPIIKKQAASIERSTTRLDFYGKQNGGRVTVGVFDRKDSVWGTVRSFLNLCQQMGINVMQADIEAVDAMNTSPAISKKRVSLQQEFADALYRQHQESGQEMEWTPALVLRNPLLSFDDGVDRKEMARKLSQWLPQLRPKQWWGKIPVVVVPPEVVSGQPMDSLTEGIIILTTDMQCEAFTTSVLACEPLCRRGLAQAFAEHYAPVIQLTVDDLQTPLQAAYDEVPVPPQLQLLAPEAAFRQTMKFDLQTALQRFVIEASGSTLEDGIYQVMFNEQDPFKGDCNNPRRLNRKMPPPGDAMDYICGNPPSICHFLDMIKLRIIGRIKQQMKEHATLGRGLLFRLLSNSVKEAIQKVLVENGSNRIPRDPSVMAYVNDLLSKAAKSMDDWIANDVQALCTRADQDDACNGWDEEIVPEILKWP
ncbi:hypothetical protein EC973_001488 [Apophysomyces ossiformis]|uniref:DUF4460 domain-containing protein n=1 Tax=Apophysomyces ossiformis TaxID=679940 RepID=A0A8H7EPA8_9FUNG|nr:hypothetical protein EC973_001488 [Apophysomyces ossiformis]